MASVVDYVLNDYGPVNDNPMAHEKVIREDGDVYNVEEVEQGEEWQAESIGISLIDPVLAHQILFF